MATYRLGSSPAVHTPGLIAWAINCYAFEADRERMCRIITDTFATVPAEAVAQLLSKAVPYTVEDETVIFAVEG